MVESLGVGFHQLFGCPCRPEHAAPAKLIPGGKWHIQAFQGP